MFSMRIRTIILLLVVLTLRTAAAERSAIRLQERVVVQQDGSADVAVTVTPDASVGLPFALPFGYGTPSSVQVSDSTLTGLFMLRDGVPVLLIDGRRISPVPLQIMVHVNALTGWSGLKAGEFGNRTVRHEFRNTTPLLISKYEGALLLPEGLTVSSIVSSDPPQTEKDPAAPFEVFVEGRRTGIIIRDSALSLGDVAQVTFRCKPAGKSPVLLICCSLAGILYLIFFRDVLKDNGNGSPAA
jgi:hypothetical protein